MKPTSTWRQDVCPGEIQPARHERHDELVSAVLDLTLPDERADMSQRMDGVSSRVIALATIRSEGSDIDGPCSDTNPTPITARSDHYLVARALAVLGDTADRQKESQARADAAMAEAEKLRADSHQRFLEAQETAWRGDGAQSGMSREQFLAEQASAWERKSDS